MHYGLELIKYYFESESQINTISSTKEDIINRCIEFDKNESDFILRLIKNIKVRETLIYFDDDLNYLFSN